MGIDITGDLTITITVQIPELAAINQTLQTIGDKLVAELTGIYTALTELTTQQASGQQALSEHLLAIEEEIRQLGDAPTQAELDAIADQIHEAAGVSAQGVQSLQAMTDQIRGMVPDTPPPSTP